MATRKMVADPAPARQCRLIADLLNAVDAQDNPDLLASAEALLHPLGVSGWPLDVRAQRVQQWGLAAREAQGLIDGLRQLGVQL